MSHYSKEFSIYVRYKLRIGIRDLQIALLLLSLSLASIVGISIGFITRNIVVVFIIAPGVTFIVYFVLWRLLFHQFQKERLRVDSFGFLALSEFLVILDTTHSLRDAMEFVGNGNYPLLSEICEECLLSENLGHSLKKDLVLSLECKCYGEISSAFLIILQNWDMAAPLIPLLADSSRARGFRKIEEEMTKIDSIASLYSGIGTIIPTVGAMLLLISGQFSIVSVSLIACGMVMIAVLLRPWRTAENLLWAGRSKHPGLKTSVFSLVLAQKIILGAPIYPAIVETLQIVPASYRLKDTRFREVVSLAQLSMFSDHDLITEIVGDYFGDQSQRLLLMAKRFGETDPRSAGEHLLQISGDLSTIEELHDRMGGKRRALLSKVRLLHLLSCVSLGILSSVSSFFDIIPKVIWGRTLDYDMVLDNILLPNFNYLILLGVLVVAGSLFPVLLDKETRIPLRFGWIVGFFSVFCLFSLLPPIIFHIF